MNRFLSVEPLELGKIAALSPEDSRHCTVVLRKKAGDMVLLVDGKGSLARGELLEAVKQHKHVAAEHRIRNAVAIHDILPILPNTNMIHLAFGIPKGQAIDFIIRRVTELGVRSFQPLITEYSMGYKNWNKQRWEKCIIEVCKQCEECYFPILHPPRSIAEWLTNRTRPLLYCDENQRAVSHGAISGKTEYDLLIGPEGGFSENERAQINKYGHTALGLGKNRLRVETAALVALTLVKYVTNEI